MAKQKLHPRIGQIFNRLTIVKLEGSNATCLCVCGAQTTIPIYRLYSGNTKSCGCLKRNVLGDHRRLHGRANSRLKGYTDRTYGIWQAMKDRCSNSNRKDWHRYGGRGISVCPEWQESFSCFIADMGNAPEHMTIDRIDVNRNYTKDNCRWASLAEQAKNQRKCIRYTLEGRTQNVSEWAKEWGVWWAQAKRRLDATGAIKV